jgi:hypothetical protein
VADIKAKQAVLTEVSWLTTSIADRRSCLQAVSAVDVHGDTVRGTPLD